MKNLSSYHYFSLYFHFSRNPNQFRHFISKQLFEYSAYCSITLHEAKVGLNSKYIKNFSKTQPPIKAFALVSRKKMHLHPPSHTCCSMTKKGQRRPYLKRLNMNLNIEKAEKGTGKTHRPLALTWP